MDNVTRKEIYGFVVAMTLLLIWVTLFLHERIRLALTSVTYDKSLCVYQYIMLY